MPRDLQATRACRTGPQRPAHSPCQASHCLTFHTLAAAGPLNRRALSEVRPSPNSKHEPRTDTNTLHGQGEARARAQGGLDGRWPGAWRDTAPQA